MAMPVATFGVHCELPTSWCPGPSLLWGSTAHSPYEPGEQGSLGAQPGAPPSKQHHPSSPSTS